MGQDVTKSSLSWRLAAPAMEWLLMPDAEQEQDDDQREWRAEQPEQDQDHLATSLYPRRAVRRGRTAGHARALPLVEAEVHTLSRAQPAADDAAGESEQDRDSCRSGTPRRGFRHTRIDRLARCRRHRGRGREADVPPVEDRPAEARHGEQDHHRDEERDPPMPDRGP